ncbi:MAG: hypothetical protein ACFFD4_37085 [Candidatus Odinarchaeota archaeon]
MPSRIAELPKKKFFPFALILYIGYLIILFILAIPYIPDMLSTISYEGGLSVNLSAVSPIIVILGAAAAVPVFLVYIIIEFDLLIDLLISPFRALNSRISLYITLFLLLQLGINLLLVTCLLLLKPNLLDLTTYSPADSIMIFGTGCVFSIFTAVLDFYIGWKWVKTDLEEPDVLHWFVGYTTYFLSVGLCVVSIQILNPTVQNIVLWPLAGIGILGAFNFFIFSFGLFIAGLEAIGSSMSSSESDAFVGFVFVTGTFFISTTLILPFLYSLCYYSGVILANRNTRQNTNRSHGIVYIKK